MRADEMLKFEELCDRCEELEAVIEDVVHTLEAMDLHVDTPLYERLRSLMEDKRG